MTTAIMIDKKCTICEKEYQIKEWQKENIKFCSMKCFNKFRCIEEKKVECLNCKKVFKRKYFRYGEEKSRFCSTICYNRHSSTNFISSIEDRFAKLLDELNILYKRQVFIKGYIHPYDFLVNQNTLVEIDGDYWHNPILRKGIDKRDLKCQQHAVAHNYQIFRFSESNIKKDLDLVKQQMEELI